MDSDRTALEQNLIATLAENGCSEKQSMLILEETLKHIDDYNSNRAENLVSQAASQAMPEPNVQVCANCKWLADRDGENNYFCNCYESETCDILIILKDTFGCNKFERKLL
jgi:hypothetical protein